MQAKGLLHHIDHSKKFSVEYLDNLQKLFAQLVAHTSSKPAYEVLICFPLFLNSLFPLIDRGIVLKMVQLLLVSSYFSKIYTHLNRFPMSDITTSFFRYAEWPIYINRFTWLKIITDYEHYIPLNLPHEMETSIRVPEAQELFL